DLGEVRIHTDADASRAARHMGALAYAVAPHIMFREGAYSPHTTAGLRLLAHELTHVVQQTVHGMSGAVVAASLGARDAGEGEAEGTADRLVAGQPVPPIRSRAAALAMQEVPPGGPSQEQGWTFAGAKAHVYQWIIARLRDGVAFNKATLRKIARLL